MRTSSILQISAVFFSFIVIGQSVAIVETVKHPKEIKQPDIFVGEVVPETNTELTASLWIESKETAIASHDLTLWVENSQPTQSVYVKLRYNPEDIKLIDQDPQRSEVQIVTNSRSEVLINKIATESGTIELLAKWQQPWVGRSIVATISAQKIVNHLTDISIDYVPQTREESYVSSGDDGRNVLIKPGVLSF